LFNDIVIHNLCARNKNQIVISTNGRNLIRFVYRVYKISPRTSFEMT